MKADLRALGVAVGVTFAGWSTARADVLDVGPFETYQTIQAAIDAATHGDTIKVQDGVYAEWLRIGSLEIRICPQAGGGRA